MLLFILTSTMHGAYVGSSQHPTKRVREYSLVCSWFPISKSSDMGSGNETFHVGAARVMAAGVNKDHLERFALESRSAVYPHRNAEIEIESRQNSTQGEDNQQYYYG